MNQSMNQSCMLLAMGESNQIKSNQMNIGNAEEVYARQEEEVSVHLTANRDDFHLKK